MSKFRFIFPLLFLVLFSQLNAQQNQSLVDKGLNAEKLGLPSRAEDYYRQAISEDPQNPLPYFLLGKSQQKRSHLDEAADMLRQAVSLNEDYAEAYECLVECYIDNDDFEGIKSGHFNGVDELIKMTSRAIELNPKSTSALCSMALIYNYKKSFTNALSWAKKALDTDSKNPRAINTLGVIYYNRGNDNEAMSQFKKTLDLDPDNIDAYLNLGVMYTRKNNHETAISYLRKGLQRDNKSIKLYYYLGIAFMQRGDDKRAIACYETIIGLDSPAYNRLGAIYATKGNYDEAIAYHQKATRLKPNDVESFKCLGKVYTDKGDYVKALRNYQKAVAINERDHETYCLIAKLYAKQGNSARETSSYKKAAKLGNKEAQAWMVSKGMAW